MKQLASTEDDIKVQIEASEAKLLQAEQCSSLKEADFKRQLQVRDSKLAALNNELTDVKRDTSAQIQTRDIKIRRQDKLLSDKENEIAEMTKTYSQKTSQLEKELAAKTTELTEARDAKNEQLVMKQDDRIRELETALRFKEEQLKEHYKAHDEQASKLEKMSAAGCDGGDTKRTDELKLADEKPMKDRDAAVREFAEKLHDLETWFAMVTADIGEKQGQFALCVHNEDC